MGNTNDDLFTLWFGSPCPPMVLTSVESWRACHSHVTLGVETSIPYSDTDVKTLEKSRSLGIDTKCIREFIKLDEVVERHALTLCSHLLANKYGPFPLASDILRYGAMARSGLNICWFDADSMCLRPLPQSCRDSFVASEHVRLGPPFRTKALFDGQELFRGRSSELRAWYSSASEPSLATNSHLRLTDSSARDLLQDFVAARPQSVTADLGMTLLRRRLHNQLLTTRIVQPSCFNPIPSWRADLMVDFLKQPLEQRLASYPESCAVHIFSVARKRSPLLSPTSPLWRNLASHESRP
jgi:hypothetical protein